MENTPIGKFVSLQRTMRRWLSLRSAVSASVDCVWLCMCKQS